MALVSSLLGAGDAAAMQALAKALDPAKKKKESNGDDDIGLTRSNSSNPCGHWNSVCCSSDRIVAIQVSTRRRHPIPIINPLTQYPIIFKKISLFFWAGSRALARAYIAAASPAPSRDDTGGMAERRMAVMREEEAVREAEKAGPVLHQGER